MKKSLVQTTTQGGHTYGQVSNVTDLMKAQNFMHSRISETIYDFLNNQKANETAGFSYALGAGNAFTVTINKPGRVYTQNGDSFELLANTTLNIAEADADYPRLDLVVAVLDDEVNAAMNLIPFVRLRTAEEFSDGVSPYAPQNINAPTELHWRAVPQIKTGTPSTVPTAPALASNEVPLYMIAVAPGASALRDADVLDVRDSILTVRKLNELVGKNTTDIADLLRRLEALSDIGNQLINIPKIFGSIRTLGDILSSLQFQINAVRDLPEIRYTHPKLALTNPATSKIPATGALDESGVTAIPVVHVEIGGVINFGDKEVILRPENFQNGAVFVKLEDNPETETKDTALTLNGVTQIAADGSADFVEKASQFLAARARAAVAARNSQYIEVFGGLAPNNLSALGDWLTYDVDNDTLTPRTPLAGLPNADRPAMFPYGDGTNVLLICGSESDSTPQVFKLNASSGAVTEIMTTKPTGVQFFGDLIAPNKIFIVAIRKEISGYETDFWTFNTGTNTFTQVSVTGSVPALSVDYAHGCYYAENQFVLVKFSPGVNNSGKTYIFDASSLVWTEINIAPPYGDTVHTKKPLSRFRLANVNGRPLLVGGLLTQEVDFSNARIWELQSSGLLSAQTDKKIWFAWDATFPPVTDAGLASTLVNGRAAGRAALLAGQGKFGDSQKHVYASVQGGIIATTYKGDAAITIADSSRFAQFTIPIYNPSFDVAGYLLSIVGDWNESNLKAEVSVDGGATFFQVTPDKMFIFNDANSVRHLRITLYNLKSSKPVLQRFVEVFDENGTNLESRVVIRYNAPETVKALYVNRDGIVTLSPVIEPSTPDRCLLHKVTPTGESTAPIVKNYINRRRPHIKYSKVKSGSAGSAQFDNELAVAVRYVNASAFIASGSHLYKIADPTVDFDATVNVTLIGGGAITTGDTWIVELEG